MQRKFRDEFHKEASVKNNIYKWHRLLMETGSPCVVERKRKRSAKTAENAAHFQKHFGENPHSSTRRTAMALDISRRTIQCVLQDLKWHPYKIHIVQKLYDKDKANRVQFALDEIALIESDPMHLAMLMWSDEAHFHIDGAVNRHNHHYWSHENPKWLKEEHLHSPRVTVWSAIRQSGIFGPYFFDENVTSERYLTTLQEQFWPAVIGKGDEDTLIFMQDGAPPHWRRNDKSVA